MITNKEKEALTIAAKVLMGAMDYIEKDSHYDEKTDTPSKAFILTGAILGTLDDLEEILDFDRPEKYQ